MAIKVLDRETASKIAAGEVIESPVSVIKELVENSIDAGATSISVTVEKAGKKLISVSDNGSGMSGDDLKLSIERYATSKIGSINDILGLSSYGFRGEALFSIFCVSKIRISSYNGVGENGYTLEAQGGDFNSINISPSSPVKGTTVEVRELFYNTPARFKFLKSDAHLRGLIIKLFEEFALIRPEIRFKLIMDGKEIYNFGEEKGKSFLKRAAEILGKDISKGLIEFDERFDNLALSGFISSTSNLISSKSFQYVYVNNRIVDSRTVSMAVYKAYENVRLSKHPVFLFSIEIDPAKIDVNVHPQKKEIKFDDESFIFNAVLRTIEKKLEIKDQSPRIEIKDSNNFSSWFDQRVEGVSESRSKNYFSQNDFIKTMYQGEKKPLWYNPPIRFVGQAFSSILIYQAEKSILLVDQHAAAERISFERYVDEFNRKSIVVQKLLLPVDVAIPQSKISNIVEMKEWLDTAGFEINQNGPSSIVVYSMPQIFELSQNLLRELFIYLSEVILKPQNISSELKRDTIAMAACKKSIKFKEKLDERSAMHLIEELKDTKDSLHCPHGRPTIVEITSDELVRKFGRSAGAV
ncbi:MAG: DNA mismatch repair endonuclease MutL [Elusimicrobiales bacterium]|nr:DNA mismatch repair endonuclease MutL [Elusimicrobiales bacterium]